MRVPEIPTTAGYAARITQLRNNEISRNFPHTFNETIAHNNKNAKFEPVNRNLYLETSYASAADEFVQRALNSAQNNSTSSYTLREVRRQCNAKPEDASESYCYINSEENGAAAENYGENTYRSFKEVFNINKAIFEECDKDFENINTLENANAYISDTDIDPIVLINSPLRDEQNGKERDIHANFVFAVGKQSLIPDTAIKNDKDIQENVIDEENLKQTDILNVEYDVENDCDDHSMIDLCNDSTKSTDGNDIDEYSISQSSSSISLRTPKHSYFSRGIINPNYPGFQHLAHTLSEHFIGSLPSESYDSDMSEYEMELSADSCDELPAEQQQQQQEAQSRKLNLFNNNHDSCYNKSKAMNLQKFYCSDETTTQPDHDVEHNTCLSHTDNMAGLAVVTRAGNLNANEELDIHSLQGNLETVLTLFESSMAASPNINSALPSISTTTTCDTKVGAKINSAEKCSSNTPDILRKNSNLLAEPMLKQQNRPDLLRGVSPRPNHNSGLTFDCIDGKHASVERSLGFPRTNDVTKDEISYGMTPVDIIGDFEQEVEREFGLLVSGYRRLMDGGMDIGEDNMVCVTSTPNEKLTDAALSGAKDQIDSEKFVNALHQLKEDQMCIEEIELQLDTTKTTNCTSATASELFLEDSNAVDWSCSLSTEQPCQVSSTEQTLKHITSQLINNGSNDDAQKPKYQKSSYDERQLPPVVIDYKRCQQSMRVARKSQSHEKNNKASSSNLKISRNHSKPSFTNRILHTKRGSGSGTKCAENNSANKKLEEAEFYQYQQLISDKELILSNSRYAKMSSWAQYLKDSVKERGTTSSTELISPSALELFDAYKIGETDLDIKTLQKHMKMAKEIEKKRRSDREEIRRRLAMGAEENCNEMSERTIWKPSIQSRIQNGMQFSHINDASSDTESHSSDSETCPKLSKTKQQSQSDFFCVTWANNSIHPYNGRPLSVSCSNNNKNPPVGALIQQQKQQQSQQPLLSLIDNEDKECDFFTKQARLQIEARMALAQAKEMAHMQIEIERQHQRVSPITEIIRGSLEKVGVQMTTDKRRVSRQMLTDMNIAQLQILVNSLHTHIEELNESLVHILMERDDLHMGQDSMLVDIEELTRYIVAKESIAKQQEDTALTRGTH